MGRKPETNYNKLSKNTYYLERHTALESARHFNLSPELIRYYLKLFNIKCVMLRPHKNLNAETVAEYAKTHTVRECAARFCLTPKSMRYYLHSHDIQYKYIYPKTGKVVKKRVQMTIKGDLYNKILKDAVTSNTKVTNIIREVLDKEYQ